MASMSSSKNIIPRTSQTTATSSICAPGRIACWAISAIIVGGRLSMQK
jgi:hypothetical protein